MRDVWTAYRSWMQNEKGYSRSTQSQYLATCQRAHAWLAEQGFQGLPWAKYPELKDYLFSTAPSATNRNGGRAALVAFFAFMRSEGWRPDDPTVQLPRLKVARRLPRPAQTDDVAKMLSVSRAYGPMVESIIHLFAYCGLRRDELRNLRWVDLEGDWLRIVGKGSKERSVPVPAPALAAWKAWRLASLSPDWVFASPRYPDRPLSKSALGYILHDIGEAVGLPKLTPHVLRHSYATELLEVCGDISVVQSALGHASPTTTAIYAKVNPSKLGTFAQGMRYGQKASRPEAVQATAKTEAAS